MTYYSGISVIPVVAANSAPLTVEMYLYTTIAICTTVHEFYIYIFVLKQKSSVVHENMGKSLLHVSLLFDGLDFVIKMIKDLTQNRCGTGRPNIY